MSTVPTAYIYVEKYGKVLLLMNTNNMFSFRNRKKTIQLDTPLSGAMILCSNDFLIMLLDLNGIILLRQL